MRPDERIEWPSAAISIQKRVLRTCRILTLGAAALAGTALKAEANPTRPHLATNSPDIPENGVEGRACAQCHSASVTSYAENPHARAPVIVDAKVVTCADCHGPEREHIASGGAKSKIFDPALAPSRQVDDMCLRCHEGKHSTFDRSAHGNKGMSCISCHSIHSAGVPKNLLKDAQTALCYQCHGDVRTQFSNSSGHRVEKGLIECTDCHDPHGTVAEGRPGAAHPQDALCANCHTAIAGPFVFAHAIVKTEGCMACHLPHGGSNPHLLRNADVDEICRQCHLPAPDPQSGAHTQQAGGHAGEHRPCTACHTDVHGSDSSPVFLRKK